MTSTIKRCIFLGIVCLTAIYTKENIFKANTTTAVKLDGDWNPVVDDSVVAGTTKPVH